MKRLILLFAALLMLAGCGKNNPSVPSGTQAGEPESKGLYDPAHPIQAQTGGAVRAYVPEGSDYVGIVPMGEKLLLVSKGTKFTALQGELGEKISEAEAGTQVNVSNPAFSVTVMGVSYYLEDSHEVVLLNPMLKETSRIPLPQDIQGSPAVSLDQQEIYYCQDNEIRALNITSGISRLVKGQDCKSMQLLGTYFEGNVLACRITGNQGTVQTIYLDSQTGQTVQTEDQISYLKTFGSDYFCRRKDGTEQQQIFGSREEDPQSLNLDTQAQAVLSLGGVVTSRKTEQGISLDFYQLRGGKRTSHVELTGIEEPVEMAADSRYVWILTGEADRQILLRWDVAQTAVTDDSVYAGPLYTAENPDMAGLAKCKDRVNELNQQYGVKISFGKDAVTESGEYTLYQEYQVPVIHRMLDDLQKVLSQFPEGFLKSSIRGGSVKICLVRRISEHLPHGQFYKNGNAYILLSLDSEIQKDFIRGFAYVVDSHVMGNSRDYDTWAELNPEGFQYDYETNAQGQNPAWLEGDNRAFVDQRSMSYPREDRAAIFEAAMSEGGEALFASPVLQQKLLRMCQGIREAYGLEKKSETYLWEQYLETSLAYTKK